MTITPAAKDIDPLRIINLAEVGRRTGYSSRTIHRRLAKDKINNTPGESFPVPLRGGKMEWREIAIGQWIDSREVAE